MCFLFPVEDVETFCCPDANGEQFHNTAVCLTIKAAIPNMYLYFIIIRACGVFLCRIKSKVEVKLRTTVVNTDRVCSKNNNKLLWYFIIMKKIIMESICKALFIQESQSATEPVHG